MPTIEVYGITKGKVEFLRRLLVNALKDASCANKLVISFVPSEVTDLKDKSQPFFRILMTMEAAREGVVKELVPLLEPLGYDIELVEMRGFIPKKM